ncbi:hypothetical protein [Limnochorda pilosa]|uniref:Spore coat protein n=1 Tax=Limnochorda pilosa TaxID=1555112 RepID=A0A0K2SLB1_LIMPI|nr:hypothetical protein [Limnochorda pilosa]BAS27890.1 hypothetical protein LIP_2049 [Limnochorda pilosa]
MAHVTAIELQSLRHLLGEETLGMAKLGTYAQNCQDPQLKSQFQKLLNECQQEGQKLLQILG